MFKLLFATLALPVVMAVVTGCASRDPYYGDRSTDSDNRYRASTSTSPVGEGVHEGVREGVRDTIRK